jgi:hypothetical protein
MRLETDIKHYNVIFKYADDTNLVVPETTIVQMVDEFAAMHPSLGYEE